MIAVAGGQVNACTSCSPAAAMHWRARGGRNKFDQAGIRYDASG